MPGSLPSTMLWEGEGGGRWHCCRVSSRRLWDSRVWLLCSLCLLCLCWLRCLSCLCLRCLCCLRLHCLCCCDLCLLCLCCSCFCFLRPLCLCCLLLLCLAIALLLLQLLLPLQMLTIKKVVKHATNLFLRAGWLVQNFRDVVLVAVVNDDLAIWTDADMIPYETNIMLLLTKLFHLTCP